MPFLNVRRAEDGADLGFKLGVLGLGARGLVLQSLGLLAGGHCLLLGDRGVDARFLRLLARAFGLGA